MKKFSLVGMLAAVALMLMGCAGDVVYVSPGQVHSDLSFARWPTFDSIGRAATDAVGQAYIPSSAFRECGDGYGNWSQSCGLQYIVCEVQVADVYVGNLSSDRSLNYRFAERYISPRYRVWAIPPNAQRFDRFPDRFGGSWASLGPMQVSPGPRGWSCAPGGYLVPFLQR